MYLPKLVKFIVERLAVAIMQYYYKETTKIVVTFLIYQIIISYKCFVAVLRPKFCVMFFIILRPKLNCMKAVITGATKGIGRAIAMKLVQQGYDVAVCARTAADLELLAAELRKSGSNIFTFKADCSIKDEVYAFCNAVKETFGSIDVLINNAGLFLPSEIFEEADDTLESQLQLNLLAPYYVTKFFGKMMIGQGSGHIFTICSVASRVIPENAGSYGVTKSALLSLNDVWRRELSRHNIKVTAVLPGPTLTSSWAGTEIPPDRFVQAGDVADMINAILNLSNGANVDEILMKPLQF